MCKWGDDVVLRVPMNAEGTVWKRKAVDSCLAPMVEVLNAAGVLTANCCCGHGKCNGTIILHDGRVLMIENESN